MASVFAMTRSVKEARMQAVLTALRQSRERPIKAIDLAAACHATGQGHETKRRRVRELIKWLREDGYQICADDHSTEGGFWLARSGSEWRLYQEAQKTKARFKFVSLRKAQEAVIDRTSGQGKLFDNARGFGCGD